MLDEILNRVPDRQAPYVGASAFAHKAGTARQRHREKPNDL